MSTWSMAGTPAERPTTRSASALRALDVECAVTTTPVRRPARRSRPSSPGRPTLARPPRNGGWPFWCQYTKPTPAPSPSSISSLTSRPISWYTWRIDPVTQWWVGKERNPENASSAILRASPPGDQNGRDERPRTAGRPALAGPPTRSLASRRSRQREEATWRGRPPVPISGRSTTDPTATMGERPQQYSNQPYAAP